jgi:hypothetical protein
MPIKKLLLSSLMFTLLFILPGCSESAPAGPKITLSETHVPAKGNIQMHGEGFTPGADCNSHLKRPDGNEFPVLGLIANEKGEFSHEIETLLLGLGKHEVWVIDTKTNKSSNVATFEVTLEQPPPAK